MEINLDSIEDECETNWWLFIRVSSDFSYNDKISQQQRQQFSVHDDDILIHKCMEENDRGMRFVKKIYYQILDGEAYLIDGKDCRELMALKVEESIKKNQFLPKGMKYEKVFQNKKIKIKFELTEYDSFTLKLNPDNLGFIQNLKSLSMGEIQSYFSALPVDERNSASDEQLADDTTFTINQISSAPTIQAVANETGGKVYIENAEVTLIDKRKSVFQEHETIFYILHLKSGKISGTGKKTELKRDFVEINAKCSKNAMEKFELEVGDILKFTGKANNHKNFGWIIQNIRKFEKEQNEEK